MIKLGASLNTLAKISAPFIQIYNISYNKSQWRIIIYYRQKILKRKNSRAKSISRLST